MYKTKDVKHEDDMNSMGDEVNAIFLCQLQKAFIRTYIIHFNCRLKASRGQLTLCFVCTCIFGNVILYTCIFNLYL